MHQQKALFPRGGAATESGMKKLLLFSIILALACLARGAAAKPAAAWDNSRTLLGTWEKIAPDAKGRVGAAVMLLESSESGDLNGDEHFVRQSVYKLPIAMAALQRVGEVEWKLDQALVVGEW